MGRRVLGEVDPGEQVVEQPAGEETHGEVRRGVRAPGGSGDRQRADDVVPVGVGRYAAEPGEVHPVAADDRAGGRVAAQRTGRAREAAVRARLPELQQRVRHRGAGTVPYAAVHGDRAGVAGRCDLLAAGEREGVAVEGPDGLGGGRGERYGRYGRYGWNGWNGWCVGRPVGRPVGRGVGQALRRVVRQVVTGGGAGGGAGHQRPSSIQVADGPSRTMSQR